MPIYLEAPANSWQRRAIARTGGNQSLLGCFVLAILGWQHGRHPPRFGKVATITKDGLVKTNMQAKDGTVYRNKILGPIQTVVDNFRGLADDLNLTDKERTEMFSELRKWFFIDERAKSTEE